MQIVEILYIMLLRILTIICLCGHTPNNQPKTREKECSYFQSDDIHGCILQLCVFPVYRYQQHELVPTNFKLVLLYPVGFCHRENKFYLITTEASPHHHFGSCCLFLFISTHQYNALLPTTARFVKYLRNVFPSCLYGIHSILHSFSFTRSLAKHYWCAIVIVFTEDS